MLVALTMNDSSSDSDVPWWNTRVAHLALLGLFSILVDLHHLALQQPIIDDRAYLTYMGQAVYRGDALYGSTTFGYPPYSALITAFVMWVGALFDMPTWLSPRYASLVLGAANAFLAYTVARLAFGCAFTGLIAGLMLTGFRFANTLDATSLESKTLVATCVLCAMLAVQNKKWLLAGVIGGVAGMIWQPAIVICLSIGISLLYAGYRNAHVLGRYTVGVVLGALPGVLYPIMQSEWRDFWNLVIVRKMVVNLPDAGDAFFKWMRVSVLSSLSEILVLALAVAGFVLFVTTQISRRESGSQRFPGNGALLSLTVGWAIVNSIDFEGAVDLVPFLPIAALWGAYCYRAILRSIAQRFSPRKTLWVGSLLLVVYLFEDEFRHSIDYTLTEQVSLVREVLGDASDVDFVSLDAEEFWVLADRAAPFRYTRSDDWVETLITIVDPGAGTVLEQTKALSPDLIVIKQKRSRMHSTVDRFEEVFYPEYELESREVPYPVQYPPRHFLRRNYPSDRTLWIFRKSTSHPDQ